MGPPCLPLPVALGLPTQPRWGAHSCSVPPGACAPRAAPVSPVPGGVTPQRVLSVPSGTDASTQASWSLVSSRAEGACLVIGPIRTLLAAFHKTVRPR